MGNSGWIQDFIPISYALCGIFTIMTTRTEQGPTVKTGAVRVVVGAPVVLSAYQQLIQDSMQDAYRKAQAEVYLSHRYYLGWTDALGTPAPNAIRGKAFRPSLALEACKAVNGNIERTLPAAIALELVHNFSTIHDDLQDRDEERHSRATVWKVWGESAAIVSGIAMLKVAEGAGRSLESAGVERTVALEAQRAITEATFQMIEGQHLDILFESRATVTVEEYLDMIARKTGALIECSAFVGALTGPTTIDRHMCNELRKVGYGLGRMFQIRDDVLGVWGGAETGKPVGADIRRKKKALPAIHLLNHSNGAAQATVLTIYQKPEPSDEDIATALTIMKQLGTKQWCMNLARETWNAVKVTIDELPLTKTTKREFTELGGFLLTRNS